MQRDIPPFRADHVGSPLRSAPLKQARSIFAAGQLSVADLKTAEATEIGAIVAGF
jgi:5-methyltetrahydropteroyltriglutamate--homocysteine methyltransferase